ncbi:MAG: hypothetical protein QOF27_3076 [Gaiellaceae bacterium]|nr:hypothetical protein [Gaiellaceae bacterium]
MARDMIAFKFLAAGTVAPFTRFRWPVGEWVTAGGVDLCRQGIHACRIRDLPIWIDAELWEIELAGEINEQARKVVAGRGRLSQRVAGWDDGVAAEFGRFCARRTRERVGFLPIVSGFVGDVDRFVARGRIPIAGFAAARAAELRDGPAAYERERQALAEWLAERLGLDE